MRKYFGSILLLSSILLVSATLGNKGPVHDGAPPAPPCSPCLVQ